MAAPPARIGLQETGQLSKDAQALRILFVTSRPPWPSRRGDQARAAGFASELARRHRVAVVAQRPPDFPPCSFPPGIRGREVPVSWWRLGGALPRGLVVPLQVAWHHQKQLADVVRREVQSFRPDVAVMILSRLGWLTPALRPVPVVLDLVDSLALNLRRRAARQPLLRPFWLLEARRFERWDRRLIREVAAATVVSARDRDALIGAPGTPGRLEVVPFGIEVGETPRSERGESIVILSGNLGYFPTLDGALWFAREVWPQVCRRHPQARWWLAGSRVPHALRRLGRRPGVEVFEDPEDLRALRRRASVAVAPLRAGSGTPIKVLEAMADSLPVVTTPEGAGGLDGTRGGEVAVGADSEAFAEQVVRLLNDPQAAARQAAAARDWLEDRHDLRRVARRFERLLEEVAAINGARPRARRRPSAGASAGRAAPTARG